MANALIANVCGAQTDPHRCIARNNLLVEPRCQLPNLIEPRNFHGYIVPGTET